MQKRAEMTEVYGTVKLLAVSFAHTHELPISEAGHTERALLANRLATCPPHRHLSHCQNNKHRLLENIKNRTNMIM